MVIEIKVQITDKGARRVTDHHNATNEEWTNAIAQLEIVKLEIIDRIVDDYRIEESVEIDRRDCDEDATDEEDLGEGDDGAAT